jgi:hypothetical protein
MRTKPTALNRERGLQNAEAKIMGWPSMSDRQGAPTAMISLPRRDADAYPLSGVALHRKSTRGTWGLGSRLPPMVGRNRRNKILDIRVCGLDASAVVRAHFALANVGGSARASDAAGHRVPRPSDDFCGLSLRAAARSSREQHRGRADDRIDRSRRARGGILRTIVEVNRGAST